MDPILAIGIIGGGLIALKQFGNKPDTSAGAGSNPDSGDAAGSGANPAFTTHPNVAANASTMGYKLISQEDYDRNGVGQGEYFVIRDGNGNITGTVVGTEGGQVFQDANGETRVRSSGDAEIEIDAPAPTPAPPSGVKTGVMVGPPIVANQSAIATTTPAIAVPSRALDTTTTNTPKLAVTKPKAPVSSAVLDKRIRATARAGLRFPM